MYMPFWLKVFFVMFLMVLQSKMGAASGYDPLTRRDPFVPLIGVQKGSPTGGIWNIFSVDDIVLQGIVVNPDGSRSAVINGEVIPEGEMIEQVFIKEVNVNSVVITLNDETHEIKLYEED